jgi:hypothetical protein
MRFIVNGMKLQIVQRILQLHFNNYDLIQTFSGISLIEDAVIIYEAQDPMGIVLKNSKRQIFSTVAKKEILPVSTSKQNRACKFSKRCL